MELETARQNLRDQTDLRNQLPEWVRSLFMEEGTVIEHRPGDRMMAAGDPGDQIRLILSGRAGVFLRENGVREIIVDSLGPGDVYGEISFLTGHPSPSNVDLVAEEHCRVLAIPAKRFSDILAESPHLALALMKNLARKVVRLERSVFTSKQKKRALKSLISREQHIFPDYVIGDYVRRHISARMDEAAASNDPVIIAGETGVGKEVLAHAIFRMSREYNEVFLLMDLLRTDPENPFQGIRSGGGEGEDDLTLEQMRLFFGSRETHPDGSTEGVPGYAELTEDGTLLVRGVEHLTPQMQQALLDAARTGSFRRPGDEKECKAKFRLICTTELDLSAVTPERHPLIHGLTDSAIKIPPLRKRRREVISLVNHYLARHSRELHREMPSVPKETMKTLLAYFWPGNDLELSATLKRALLVAQDGVLRPNDIYFRVTRIEGRWKLNLLKFRPVAQAVRSPLFPAILQSAVTPFFFILLGLLFLGPTDPLKNPASLFSWALGWPALVGGAFLWARFWCTLCPMGTVGHLAKKLIALERPFPSFLKNRGDLLVAAAVLFVIWLETATHMRDSPFNVGLLILAITLCSVFVSVVFERQSWCRYLCPLGNMTAVLAKGAVVELRADQNVCASQCMSPVCFFGTDTREGCPFGHVAPTVSSNLDCKLCGACVKNCPHGAVNLNLRIPGQELLATQRANTVTAFLVISMLGGLLSEMVSEMPAYARLTAGIPLPEIVRFTVMFTGLVIGVNVISGLVTVWAKSFYGDAFHENYARFGMALLPLTLTAFMAYHLYYLINLGVQLPILVSQNFDLALFRQLIIRVPPELTYQCQQVLIWIGLVWSLIIVYRFGRASRKRFAAAVGGMLPQAMLVVVMAFTLVYAIKMSFYK